MTPKEYEKLKGTPYYAERNGELPVKPTNLPKKSKSFVTV